MDTSKRNKVACICSCHENKLNKPYEHDDRCCLQMNGWVRTPGLLEKQIRQQVINEVVEEIEEMETYTPDEIKKTNYRGEYHFIDMDKLRYILNH